MKTLSALGLAAVLAAVMPVSGAQAQRVSKINGRTLGKMCSSPRSSGLCDAYLAGLADSEVWSKKYDEHADDAKAPVAFCVPASETTAQLRETIVSWLHRHEEALSDPAGKGVYRAYHEAYPCHAAPEGTK